MTTELTAMQKNLMTELSGGCRVMGDTKGIVTMFTPGDNRADGYTLPALATIEPDGLGVKRSHRVLPRTIFSLVAKKALAVIETYTGVNGVTYVLYGPTTVSTVSKATYGPQSNVTPETF